MKPEQQNNTVGVELGKTYWESWNTFGRRCVMGSSRHADEAFQYEQPTLNWRQAHAGCMFEQITQHPVVCVQSGSRG